MKLLVCMLIRRFIECSHTLPSSPIRFTDCNVRSKKAAPNQELEMQTQYAPAPGSSTPSSQSSRSSSTLVFEMSLDKSRMPLTYLLSCNGRSVVPHPQTWTNTAPYRMQASTVGEPSCDTMLNNIGDTVSQSPNTEQPESRPQVYQTPEQDCPLDLSLTGTFQSIPCPRLAFLLEKPLVHSDTISLAFPKGSNNGLPENRRPSLGHMHEICGGKLRDFPGCIIESALLKGTIRIDHFFRNSARTLYFKFIQIIAKCHTWCFWTFKWNVTVVNPHTPPLVSNINITASRSVLQYSNYAVQRILKILQMNLHNFETDVRTFFYGIYAQVMQKAMSYGLDCTHDTRNPTISVCATTTNNSFETSITQLYHSLMRLLARAEASLPKAEVITLRCLITDAYAHALYLDNLFEQAFMLVGSFSSKHAEIHKTCIEAVQQAMTAHAPANIPMHKKHAILNEIYTKEDLETWMLKMLNGVFINLHELGQYAPNILFMAAPRLFMLSNNVSTVLRKTYEKPLI